MAVLFPVRTAAAAAPVSLTGVLRSRRYVTNYFTLVATDDISEGESRSRPATENRGRAFSCVTTRSRGFGSKPVVECLPVTAGGGPALALPGPDDIEHISTVVAKYVIGSAGPRTGRVSAMSTLKTQAAVLRKGGQPWELTEPDLDLMCSSTTRSVSQWRQS
jgi:hypothetical protein